MTVREFIEQLQEKAVTKGLMDAPIMSVGSGQCRMDETPKVYHYYVVKVKDEQLRVFTDYKGAAPTLEDILKFNYRAVAFDDDEKTLADVLPFIPAEVKIKCVDTINIDDYDIPYKLRDFEIQRHGTRTVVDITGDNSEITITLG